MKTTLIIILSMAVFLAAYYLLQDVSVVAPSSVKGVNKPDVETVGSTTGELLDSSDTAGNAAGNNGTYKSTALQKEKPLEPEIRAAVQELVNTSHEGLVEEKTQNGVTVDLKGRFRTAPVATVNEKGEVTVRDYTSAPVE